MPLSIPKSVPVLVALVLTLPLLVAEPALAADQNKWRSLDVVDAHGHVGDFEGFDLDLEHLLKNAERYGVEKVLVSNVDGAELEETANLDEVETNRRALEIIEQHPELLRGIVWTRPTDGSAEAVVPFLAKRLANGERAFVGLKIHPEMNDFPADDPRVDPYFELAAERGVPVVYHCGKPGTNSAPSKILGAARRHPDVPVILYHMGFKGPHEPAIDAVRAAVVREEADLYLGTAQADPAAVVRAVTELGADRVVFGTDAVYYGAEHYEHYEPMIEALDEALSKEDLALVLGGNARRLFGLGSAE